MLTHSSIEYTTWQALDGIRFIDTTGFSRLHTRKTQWRSSSTLLQGSGYLPFAGGTVPPKPAPEAAACKVIGQMQLLKEGTAIQGSDKQHKFVNKMERNLIFQLKSARAIGHNGPWCLTLLAENRGMKYVNQIAYVYSNTRDAPFKPK
jgi:hypothetical protein